MAIAQQDFSMLSDQQLQQAMRFAQRSNNTPEFLGLMAEAQKRAKMRSEAQGMQAGQEAAQQPATLADQVMSGIANLDPGDQTYASGGIVAFAGGDLVRSTSGGKSWTLDVPDTMRDPSVPFYREIANPLAALAKRTFDTREEAAAAYDNAYRQAYAPSVGREGQATAVRALDNALMSDMAPVQPAALPARPGQQAAAPAPRAERSGVVGTERVSGPGRTPSSVPEQAAAAVQSGIMSRDEYSKAMEAYAEGDNKVVDSIFAKSMERDAKRRAELEGENASTKGWLGIDISGDTRKAIQDAGIALLRSKKPYLDIGEGIAAGLEGYDKRKEDRRGKLELLDKAEETRNLAILAAKQGNRKAAGEFMAKYDAYVDQIKDNERADKTLAATERHQKATEDLQRRQIGVTAAGYNRPTDADKYIAAAIKENPSLTYTQAYDKYIGAKGVARPLSYDTALTQFQKGIKDGIIPTGTNFATWYQEQLDGSASPGGLSLPTANAIAAELAKRKN